MSIVPEREQPPFSDDAERSLLGFLVLKNEVIDVVSAKVPEEAFYQRANRLIYHAILDAFRERKAVDLVTLKETLGESAVSEVGGIGYLASIVERVPQTNDPEPYVAIVVERYVQRAVLASAEALKRSVLDKLDGSAIQKAIAEIRSALSKDDSTDITACAEDALKSVSTMRKSGVSLTSGMSAIDECLSGIRPGLLYTIGGKTSHGKTTFAINLAHANLRTNEATKVLYNVFENKDQISTRLASIDSGIPLERFLKPYKISEDEYKGVEKSLVDLAKYTDRIKILDSAPIDKMRAVADEYAPNIIVVDFLQRYAHRHQLSTGGNLSHEIGKVVSDLQDLALEKNAAVFCLSQFSRRPHDTRHRPPEVEDLKESGDIENYSDVIALLYWPWRDSLDDGRHNRNSYKILIRKNKLGPCMDVDVRIDTHTLKLGDWGK